MSDNIQVAIRVRPLNSRELSMTQGKKCIQVSRPSNSVSISVNSSYKNFNYDLVEDEDVSQDSLFENIGKPVALSCLHGYNGSIFAYGQTGSGKTYTIMGGLQDFLVNFQFRGILPRCLEFIFSNIKREVKKNVDLQYLVKCSFVEIYNEQINDLINPEQKNLQLREDIKKGVYVENIQQETVTTFDETFEIINKGIKSRHTGSTNMNNESSRSHSVFTLQIESKEKREDLWNFRTSLFHLIDLAGSERQKMTETFGERLKEAGMINKSLSSLGNVINSLVEISEGRTRHVPYRDSKLTFLLKDSLGGNSKTTIIANISPSSACYGETLSTLRFAERAKLVKNRAVVNEDSTGTVSELKEEIKRLKDLLKTQGDSASQMFCVDFNERIKNVEGLLEHNLRIRLHSEAAMKNEINDRDSYITSLSEALEKCEKKIVSDRKTIRSKDEMINKLLKGEKLQENKLIQDLRAEIESLRKENEHNPVTAMLAAENTKLKSQIVSIENELKESSSSLRQRLQDNQSFTEKLQIALRKSVHEREKMHILLEEYSKNANTLELQTELQAAKKKTEDLMESLNQEKSRVLSLEQQLNSLTISQIVDTEVSLQESKLSGFNASEFMSVAGTDGQAEMFNKFLEEDKWAQEEKIKTLEEKIKEITEENCELRRVEEENFKYEEEIEKLRREVVKKEDKIDELLSEIETISAENEFLSTQFIELGQQLNQKERKISELTDKLSLKFDKGLVEENTRLLKEAQENSKKNEEDLERMKKVCEELEKTKKSRDELAEEVKKLDGLCDSVKNTSEDKDSSFASEQGKNEEFSVGAGVGHKMKLHVKMKEENNKLKEQNYQLREEIRKKNEKIENLSRKVEVLAKSCGNNDFLQNLGEDREN